MKTIAATTIVIAFAISGCDQNNNAPINEAEKARLHKEWQAEQDRQQYQQKQSQDLDRETARKILNAHFLTPSTRELNFSPQGYSLAKQESIVTEKQGTYNLTAKGIQVFGDLADTSGPKSQYFKLIEFYSTENAPHINLVKPIAQTVVSVDGISGTISNEIKQVDFTAEYILPSNTSQEILRYIYGRQKSSALFKKYDDGWRFERLQW